MFTFIGINNEPVNLPNTVVWVGVAISIAIALAFYALRSIALFKMAKKRGIRKAFLAWFPLLWFFIACKLVGKVKIFGSTFEKLAVWFCLIFSLAEFLAFAYEFLIYFPVIGNFLAGNQLYILPAEMTTGKIRNNCVQIWEDFEIYGRAGQYVNPYVQAGISTVINGIMTGVYYASMVFDLLSIVVTLSLFVQLFKKYWPSHFVLATILSFILGLFPIFAFVVRNKEPMDYTEFLRSRYNSFYANGNPYGGAYQNRPPQDVPPTPFEEFADKDEIDPGEPFSEFASKKDDKRL